METRLARPVTATGWATLKKRHNAARRMSRGRCKTQARPICCARLGGPDMGILDIFKRKAPETRASASGFTAEIMSARESYISGRRGLAELTATAQTCVSLWEGAMTLAKINGTDLIGRRVMAMAGRSLALRGEAVFLIRDDRLVPVSDWIC